MLEFLIIVGAGMTIGVGFWVIVFAVRGWIANCRVEEQKVGLANDGDDWAPFPSIQSSEPSNVTTAELLNRATRKRPDIEQQVCQDILKRQKMGIVKYGTAVADNPLSLRAWLQHAYEESLDLPIYLKRAIAEIDEKAGK